MDPLMSLYVVSWTSRTYSKEGGPLPSSLTALCSEVLKALHLPPIHPQAAIVNVYRTGDRLRGHKDDVEEARDAPLVSVSLGVPCIFLVGGESREDKPISMVLRSGDVIVLAGKARQYFHGVPKLLYFTSPPPPRKGRPPPSPPPLPQDDLSSSGCDRVKRYLWENRINISLRQVRERRPVGI
eukprot:GHVS01056990.1.p1 GENE.GHVS01056990.1~~GHVS01056990.1.p1  ORF type:complete len:183 (+),score=30.98 GHVS01056990.1:145-693(+)